MGLSIAITGAGGFIGRACVSAALRRGHDVCAILRRPEPGLPEAVRQVTCDLAENEGFLIEALTGSDVVIHAAAAMSGDPGIAERDTIAATRALLAAMARSAPDARLILVSSITVYDADARDISEDTPLDPEPQTRDAYARSKLAQEALLDDAALEGWIVRPGAVFGPGRVWNAHLGYRLGPLFLRLGNRAAIPLIGRVPCAEALVLAAELPPPGGGLRAVNLVESDLPDARRFLTALGPAAPRLQIPVPWKLFAATGHVLGLVPGLRHRLPGLLRPRTLRARFGRKHYSNARAQAELRWVSRQPFENAIHSALDHEHEVRR